MNPESMPPLLERAARTVEVGPVPDLDDIRRRGRRAGGARRVVAAAGMAVVVAALVVGTTFALSRSDRPDAAPTEPTRPGTGVLGPTHLAGYGHLLFRVPTSWPTTGIGSTECGRVYWYTRQRVEPTGDLVSPCTPITAALTSLPSASQDAVAYGPGDPATWLTAKGPMDPDHGLAEARVAREHIDGVAVLKRQVCSPKRLDRSRAVFCRAVVYVPSEDAWFAAGVARPPGRRGEASRELAALLHTVQIDPSRIAVPPVPFVNVNIAKNLVPAFRRAERAYQDELVRLGLTVSLVGHSDGASHRSTSARITTSPPAGTIVRRGAGVSVRLRFR